MVIVVETREEVTVVSIDGSVDGTTARELVDRLDYEVDEERGNRLTLVKRFVPRQNPGSTEGSRS